MFYHLGWLRDRPLNEKEREGISSGKQQEDDTFDDSSSYEGWLDEQVQRNMLLLKMSHFFSSRIRPSCWETRVFAETTSLACAHSGLFLSIRCSLSLLIHLPFFQTPTRQRGILLHMERKSTPQTPHQIHAHTLLSREKPPIFSILPPNGPFSRTSAPNSSPARPPAPPSPLTPPYSPTATVSVLSFILSFHSPD